MNASQCGVKFVLNVLAFAIDNGHRIDGWYLHYEGRWFKSSPRYQSKNLKANHLTVVGFFVASAKKPLCPSCAHLVPKKKFQMEKLTQN
ncbi:MAG: hypothetical protein N0E48_15745 [Candidatus Thiodiazotropha endolucinida]|nr:hypothetical protein [Candidatus Thiodiazotropha endolucinida]